MDPYIPWDVEWSEIDPSSWDLYEPEPGTTRYVNPADLHMPSSPRFFDEAYFVQPGSQYVNPADSVLPGPQFNQHQATSWAGQSTSTGVQRTTPRHQRVNTYPEPVAGSSRSRSTPPADYRPLGSPRSCNDCSRNPITTSRIFCERHLLEERVKRRERRRERVKEAKQQGKCEKCLWRDVAPGKAKCRGCLDYERDQKRKAAARRRV